MLNKTYNPLKTVNVILLLSISQSKLYVLSTQKNSLGETGFEHPEANVFLLKKKGKITISCSFLFFSRPMY